MALDRWLTAVRMRLRSLTRRRRADRELDEELQFHLEQATAEYVSRGMTPAEARRAALVAMGGVDQRKEECREARGLGLLRSTGRDLLVAGRMLKRQPGISVLVVLTLAVGVGAVVSVASVAHWLLLRPLPGVTDPDALVSIRLHREDVGSASAMSFNDLESLSQGVSALNGLTGSYDMPAHVAVSLPDRAARRVAVEFVMANYFDVLGVNVNGQGFTRDEERIASAATSVVISERLARGFGSDAILGKTIRLNGEPARVVGIAMDGFLGAKRLTPVDAWMPIAQRWISLPAGLDRSNLGPNALMMWGLVGRRDREQSIAVLQEQVSAVEEHIAASAPPTSTRLKTHDFVVLETLELFFRVREHLVYLFQILTVAAGLLLMLACANVSNTLLARSMARAGELATRLAMGASRLSLARVLFYEILVLSLMAGAVGLGLARVTATWLEGRALAAMVAPLERIHVDWVVVAASVVLCVVVAGAAALSPMWSLRHARVSTILQQSSRSVTSSRWHLTRGLLAVQVAISVVLLIGAALFVRTIDATLGIDVGFERSRVQTFRLDPRQPAGDSSLVFRQDLIARLGSIPGVEAASVAFLPPFYSGMEAQILVRDADAHEDAAELRLMLNAVHPGFFDTVGLSFVAGRDFTNAELNIPQEEAPLILPESVAARVFGKADAVGRFVTSWGKGRRQVVGVVRDSRQRQLTHEHMIDLAFQPHRADYQTPFITGIVRGHATIWPDVRRVLADMDPSIVMFEAKSVEDGIRTEMGSQILTMHLALAFGGAAVFLAAVGLASVLACVLANRRRELAIRTALGATPTRLAAHIGGQSVVVLLVGVGAGALASAWLTRYIESRLYGVSRLDPVSFGIAIVIVVAIMIAASLPVCRRAARVNPAAVLEER